MAAYRSTEYRFTPKPETTGNLYWTTKACEELAALLPLAPLAVRSEIPAKIETWAAGHGRESVSGATVMLFFKEAF